MSQQEFENYLALIGRLLRFDAKQREAVAAEFRAHLEDRLDDLLSRGYDRDQAVRLAIEEFGDAAGLAAELANISRGRRRRWIMRCTTATVGGLAVMVLLAMAFWPEGGRGPTATRLVAQEERAAEAKPSSKPQKPVSIEEKLSQAVTVDFAETPLRDVLAYLTEQTKIQFYVKTKSLEDVGATLDLPFSLDLKDVRLRTVLELLLEQADLTYVVREDLLVITSLDNAEATMEIRVYDCRDLLSMKPVKGTASRASSRTMEGLGGGMGGGGGYFNVPDRETLSAGVVPAGILPQFGGGAPAAASPPAANPAANPEAQPSSPAAGNKTGGMPGMGSGMDGMGMGMFPGGSMPGRIGEVVNGGDALIDLLTTTIEPDSWHEMGGPGSLAMFNGLLVVRQSSRTHDKVERVLNMLRESANLEPANIRVTK